MLQNKHIVLAGGSGFIGGEMVRAWGKLNRITILTRQIQNSGNNNYHNNPLPYPVSYVQWDGRTAGDWVASVDGCDLLINLTGRSVNCRYTEHNKAIILSSRVQATEILGYAVQQSQKPPALWINGASTTIYRHAEDRPQDELTGEVENDFSVQVCKAWEAAFNNIELPDTRKAILRMAIVLGDGGALTPYVRLARLGLGGHQGNGRQMFSWIHAYDLCRIAEWLWENPGQSGIFNATAPFPVTNRELMGQIRRHIHMPFGLPAPAWMLEAGAALIGTETELLLKSRWVLPARLLEQGFVFRYPTLDKALTNLIR